MKSRKVIKIISGSLFIIFLTLFVFDDSFTQLTSYENLKPIVLQIIANSLSGNISQAELNQSYNIMLLACEDKKSIEVPLTNIGNITIPCDQINSTTPQNLDNLIASLAFDKIYYTEFSCDFINCIKENNYNVIFSSYGNKFFCNLQPYLLIITIALGILFFFSLENLFEKLKSFGAALLFSSIPNVALNYLKDVIFSNFKGYSYAMLILNKLFSIMLSEFIIILIIGIILFLMGYFIERKKKK